MFYRPLDQNCPVVERFMSELFDDPMTEPTDDLLRDFERKHRVKCKHCREYGAANIEVV